MIIYNSKIFKLPIMRNYIGITLTSRLLLFKYSKEQVSKRLMKHELIGHGTQFILADTAAIKGQIDGIMVIWITYLLNYLYLLVKYRSHWKAYKGIIWERLAREFEVV